MSNTWIDWRESGGKRLDPELKNISASSLITGEHPRQYALASFQVGMISIVVGVLLFILSVYGSTTWTPNTPHETVESLLILAVVGAVLSSMGTVIAVVSSWFQRLSPKM